MISLTRPRVDPQPPAATIPIDPEPDGVFLARMERLAGPGCDPDIGDEDEDEEAFLARLDSYMDDHPRVGAIGEH